MKTVFVYDEDGFYCGTHIAQLNPRNKSSWLMPPHSTNVDPNDEDGFFFKIKDPGNPESGWDKIPYPSTAEDFLALNIPHESRTKRNNDLRRLLSQFAQNDPEHYREVSVNDESGKKIATKLEVIPEPTPEELKERAAAARLPGQGELLRAPVQPSRMARKKMDFGIRIGNGVGDFKKQSDSLGRIFALFRFGGGALSRKKI